MAHHSLKETKVFGLESEILIKYKRIKWTPRVKASLLSSQGDKTKVFGVESEILIKYKRIKWTPRVKASLLSSQGDKKSYFDVMDPTSKIFQTDKKLV